MLIWGDAIGHWNARYPAKRATRTPRTTASAQLTSKGRVFSVQTTLRIRRATRLRLRASATETNRAPFLQRAHRNQAPPAIVSYRRSIPTL